MVYLHTHSVPSRCKLNPREHFTRSGYGVGTELIRVWLRRDKHVTRALPPPLPVRPRLSETVQRV